MNHFHSLGIALCLALFCAPVIAADPPAPPPADRILATLKTDHPRLLIDAAGFDALRDRIKSDARLREWDRELRRKADRLLDTPPRQYEIPDGKRLLAVSRAVLDRTYLLALTYMLHGDVRHRDRLYAELSAAAAFKDWNPSHFLDTAEMTHAFAIGYDWLYADWSPDQRRTIRQAIIKHGLTPGRNSYQGKERYGWWVGAHHNWNQVCNGGMLAGALAIADEEPELARIIVAGAVASLPRALHDLAPDGAWPEGPGYWHYATRYTVWAIAMLDSALGEDFGLSDTPGLAETGRFGIYATGPLGRTFNFADGRDSMNDAPFMRWLGRRFDRPEFDGFADARPRFDPLDLVWYRGPGKSPVDAKLPLDAYFRGVELASFRSAWSDANATFVAVQAGSNTVNHNHLDLGSFVLDAAGRRWIVDMHHDDYNLPGYFGGQRYTYYRNRAESHNTLVLNPSDAPDQRTDAECRIARFESRDALAFAIADLSPAYTPHARSVKRGVALIDRRDVIVQDEIASDASGGADVYWFVHTAARVALSDDGRTATLTQGGKTLTAVLVTPDNLRFTADRAGPLATSPRPKGQDDDPDLTRLTIHAPAARDLTLMVRFNVGDRADAGSVTPLVSW